MQSAEGVLMERPSPAAGRPRRREPRTGLLGVVMDALFKLLRWIEGHVRGFHAAVGVYLAIGFTLSFVALLGFLTLAQLVGGSAIERFDVGVLRWLRAHRAPWLDGVALIGTALGSGVAVYVVLVIAGGLLWRSRHHLSALLLLLTLVGGRALIGLLKAFYDRPRPGLYGAEIQALGMRFDYPESASFPSGHAITAVVVFGTLAYLVARLERTRRLRRITLGVALLLIAVIGFSRLYFAVHYPSDVLAGFLAGLLWATFCAFAVEVVAYFIVRRPAAIPEEAELQAGMLPVREALRPETGGQEPEHPAANLGTP